MTSHRRVQFSASVTPLLAVCPAANACFRLYGGLLLQTLASGLAVPNLNLLFCAEDAVSLQTAALTGETKGW